jgi:pimeloyl-ACP methyl ester carboxylesterase
VTGSSIEEAVTAMGVGLVDPFWMGAIPPDRGLMRTHGLDRVPKPEREAILARIVPESGRAVREVLNWWMDPFMTTSVGPGPLGTPALAVAGERDVVHSATTVRATAERIGASYHAMPGMSHWLIGEAGWEQVAELVLKWLAREAKAAAA